MILLLLAVFTGYQAQASATAAPRCLKVSVVSADVGRPRPVYRRLADQPPANEYLAVERRVANCREPAVVRTGIGR